MILMVICVYNDITMIFVRILVVMYFCLGLHSTRSDDWVLSQAPSILSYRDGKHNNDDDHSDVDDDANDNENTIESRPCQKGKVLDNS